MDRLGSAQLVTCSALLDLLTAEEEVEHLRGELNAILALARGLGVATTAEGVETEAQADVMRELGCTQLQGFHFGRPVRAEQLPPSEAEARRSA